ncbi:hypothetical protein D3C81_1530980 [compost metagenome]
MAVQGFAAGITREQFAVPIRITALACRVPLQIDRARSQAGAGQFDQRGVVHARKILGGQSTWLAIVAFHLQHQWRDQHLWITA